MALLRKNLSKAVIYKWRVYESKSGEWILNKFKIDHDCVQRGRMVAGIVTGVCL